MLDCYSLLEQRVLVCQLAHSRCMLFSLQDTRSPEPTGNTLHMLQEPASNAVTEVGRMAKLQQAHVYN